MSIVAGGMSLALLLGRPGPPGETDARYAGDRIVLRRRAGPETLESAASSRFTPNSEPTTLSVASFPASAESTVAVPGDRPDVLPPTLAKSFPSVELAASARWGVSMGIGISGAGIVGQPVRTHKIVNGDCLPALAKRYLGSEDRAGEIFEANRDLLSSPDALPIGIELRIPPRDGPKADAKATAGPPALVPITPRGSRGGALRGMNSE